MSTSTYSTIPCGHTRQAGSPFYFYTAEESRELSAPWRIAEPGLVPAADFLGRPEGFVEEAEREGVGLEFYVAILEKPLSE